MPFCASLYASVLAQTFFAAEVMSQFRYFALSARLIVLDVIFADLTVFILTPDASNKYVRHAKLGSVSRAVPKKQLFVARNLLFTF